MFFFCYQCKNNACLLHEILSAITLRFFLLFSLLTLLSFIAIVILFFFVLRWGSLLNGYCSKRIDSRQKMWMFVVHVWKNYHLYSTCHLIKQEREWQLWKLIEKRIKLPLSHMAEISLQIFGICVGIISKIMRWKLFFNVQSSLTILTLEWELMEIKRRYFFYQRLWVVYINSDSTKSELSGWPKYFLTFLKILSIYFFIDFIIF